ncbi:PPOX class F420-dependent oxidoreductase [Halobacteriaceae archaeon GCM10025711]
MATIPDEYVDLLERPTFAALTTLLPDGMPHVTPVWIDYDGEHVQFNTLEGRQKERNLRRDPRAAVLVVDPDDPYRYLSVRGDVVSMETEGADEHIDRLAQEYMGVDEYPNRGEESGDRLIVSIRPDGVMTAG